MARLTKKLYRPTGLAAAAHNPNHVHYDVKLDGQHVAQIWSMNGGATWDLSISSEAGWAYYNSAAVRKPVATIEAAMDFIRTHIGAKTAAAKRNEQPKQSAPVLLDGVAVSVSEAAQRLNLSEARVRRMLSENKLRSAGRGFIEKSSLEAELERRENGGQWMHCECCKKQTIHRPEIGSWQCCDCDYYGWPRH